MMGHTTRYRWGRHAWLLWALLVAAQLAAFAAGFAVSAVISGRWGRLPDDLATAVTAAATVTAVIWAWQSARPRPPQDGGTRS
jgi:hypothetical protein